MSKVFVNIGLSLDGYMAPAGMAIEHWDNPQYQNGGAKWGALMGWLLSQRYFRENLGFGPGGETGPVNEMVRHTMERTGANINGQANVRARRGLLARAGSVSHSGLRLTHDKREPWVRPGGTTFYFVNEGPDLRERAVERRFVQARA